MKAAAVWAENNNRNPGPNLRTPGTLPGCRASHSEREPLPAPGPRKAVPLMRSRPAPRSAGRGPGPWGGAPDSKGGRWRPRQTGHETKRPCPQSRLSCRSWLPKAGRALLWRSNAQGGHASGDGYGRRKWAGDSESRFYPGFTEFRPCNFIHVYMSPLGSKWLPTAFRVEAEIVTEVHKPLHTPASAVRSDSTPYLSALSCFHASQAVSLLRHPPTCLCPRSFALSVSSSWNTTRPHHPGTSVWLVPLLHLDLSGNVTLPDRPLLRAAGLYSITCVVCTTPSDVTDALVNICLSLLEWGFLF